jgi:hypothetical protein
LLRLSVRILNSDDQFFRTWLILTTNTNKNQNAKY